MKLCFSNRKRKITEVKWDIEITTLAEALQRSQEFILNL